MELENISRHISSLEEWNQHVVPVFEADNPRIGGMDTETTGLTMTKDKPFLIIFGWLDRSYTQAKIFTFDIDLLDEAYRLTAKLNRVYFHNALYDLNMLENINKPYPHDNVGDTMVLARSFLPVDSLEARRLGLKVLAKQFISPLAGVEDALVKKSLQSLNRQRRSELKALLKANKLTYKGFTEYYKINETLNRYSDKTSPYYNVLQEWRGDATYADVDRELMLRYAANDVYWTLALFLYFTKEITKLSPEIVLNLKTLIRREFTLIPIYLRQQRVGLPVDFNYLEASLPKINAVIEQLYSKFHALTGNQITVRQNEVLKTLVKDRWNIEVDTFDNTILSDFVNGADYPNELKQMADLILQLRTLLKWKNTYLCPYYHAAKDEADDRLHPSINSTGAVSGRISSNLQQMPRVAIYWDGEHTHFVSKDAALEGWEELFSPRRCIISPEGYQTFYMDANQHELRMQANYTIMAGKPDHNLINAFIPYKLDEFDEMMWEPTDLHGLNATTAFGEDARSAPNWKSLRAGGKTVNFAVNYGAGLNALYENPNLKAFTSEQITRLYNAYKHNFPGVLNYQRWVSNQIRKKGYMTNMFGRVYRFNDARWAYKCANYLIQGSCADMIKEMLILIEDALKPFKACSILTVHDEVQFFIPHEEIDTVVPILFKIMNKDWDGCVVPIVVEVENTLTNWAYKGDWDGNTE